MEERQTNRVQKLEIIHRKSAFITGVKDVKSFDEQEVLLETDLGMLLIRGSGLKVEKISVEKGEAELQGRINSMIYSEPKGYTKSGESILKRMFR